MGEASCARGVRLRLLVLDRDSLHAADAGPLIFRVLRHTPELVCSRKSAQAVCGPGLCSVEGDLVALQLELGPSHCLAWQSLPGIAVPFTFSSGVGEGPSGEDRLVHWFRGELWEGDV